MTEVDVVVAVHDPARPLARTVASALTGNEETDVRVTVACHELDPEEVRPLLPPETLPHVRFLEVRDGLGSPSGPYNAGIDAATARWVSIVGSDDHLEPGALAAWADLGDRLGSDVVLAPIRLADGSPVRTPRVRLGRSQDLDPVRDRLAYRTAPLGLMRRSTLNRLGLRLTPGMRSGGDVAFTARLWTCGVRIDLAAGTPAYVVGTTAATRVTTAVRPVPEELRAFEDLLDRPWVLELPEDRRRALAVKTIRIHVLGALRRRPAEEDWTPEEVAWVRRLVGRWVALAPGVLDPFSVADRALLDAVLRSGADPASVSAAVRRRNTAGRLAQWLAPRPLANLDRESTLRARAGDLATAVLDGTLRRSSNTSGGRP